MHVLSTTLVIIKKWKSRKGKHLPSSDADGSGRKWWQDDLFALSFSPQHYANSCHPIASQSSVCVELRALFHQGTAHLGTIGIRETQHHWKILNRVWSHKMVDEEFGTICLALFVQCYSKQLSSVFSKNNIVFSDFIALRIWGSQR